MAAHNEPVSDRSESTDIDHRPNPLFDNKSEHITTTLVTTGDPEEFDKLFGEFQERIRMIGINALIDERERCAKIADEVRHVPDGDNSSTAGVWRLACSEISQRIRHGT